MDNSPLPRSFNKLKSLQNLLSLSAVTLVITVWSTVSFLAYQNKLLGKYAKELNQSVYSVKNTPTPDANGCIPNDKIVQDWKTYTNTRKNYQINYPPNWAVSEDVQPAEINGRKIILDLVTIDKNGDIPRIEIDSANKFGLTESQIKLNNISQLKIGRLDTYFEIDNDEDGGTFTNYYFIKDNHTYTITTIIYPQDTASNVQSTFNQILSTFKFLDDTNKIEESCERNGFVWFTDYNECEYVPNTEKLELFVNDCSKNNGKYDSCNVLAECRHNTNSKVCADVCVSVCMY